MSESEGEIPGVIRLVPRDEKGSERKEYRMPVHRRFIGNCPHLPMVIDEDAGAVYCEKCGIRIDTFRALTRLIQWYRHHIEWPMEEIKEHQAKVKVSREEQKARREQSRAANERAGRYRGSVDVRRGIPLDRNPYQRRSMRRWWTEGWQEAMTRASTPRQAI